MLWTCSLTSTHRHPKIPPPQKKNPIQLCFASTQHSTWQAVELLLPSHRFITLLLHYLFSQQYLLKYLLGLCVHGGFLPPWCVKQVTNKIVISNKPSGRTWEIHEKYMPLFHYIYQVFKSSKTDDSYILEGLCPSSSSTNLRSLYTEEGTPSSMVDKKTNV